jgi:hypothetical protein
MSWRRRCDNFDAERCSAALASTEWGAAASLIRAGCAVTSRWSTHCAPASGDAGCARALAGAYLSTPPPPHPQKRVSEREEHTQRGRGSTLRTTSTASATRTSAPSACFALLAAIGDWGATAAVTEARQLPRGRPPPRCALLFFLRARRSSSTANSTLCHVRISWIKGPLKESSDHRPI